MSDAQEKKDSERMKERLWIEVTQFVFVVQGKGSSQDNWKMSLILKYLRIRKRKVLGDFTSKNTVLLVEYGMWNVNLVVLC